MFVNSVKRLRIKRTSEANGLAYPWVREGGNASDIPIDISVLNNMRQFVKYGRLKQFALRALASTLDEEELADLKDQFAAIDVDKNGSISLEEMKEALAQDLPWKMKEPRVLEILQALLFMCIEWRNMTQRSGSCGHRPLFEKFDIDRDGYINPRRTLTDRFERLPRSSARGSQHRQRWENKFIGVQKAVKNCKHGLSKLAEPIWLLEIEEDIDPFWSFWVLKREEGARDRLRILVTQDIPSQP